jgi:hypothetical protein
MEETPNALIKDLLSTGYFSEELKNYSGVKEIDLLTFSRAIAVPYLTRECQSCLSSGQKNKSKILSLAIKFLSDVNDDNVTASIFGLKKFATGEVDNNEKVLCGDDPLGKAELAACRQKSEAAQSLGKLLVTIIRTFKLSEVIAKGDKSKEVRDSVADLINDDWQLSVPQRK